MINIFEFINLALYLPRDLGDLSRVISRLEREGLTRDDIRMIIPDLTLERRLAAGEDPLTVEEGDALVRLLQVISQAREVFGDATLADEWLRSANPALGGNIPIRMARTDLGGREVETVLGRIAHGVFG
jgi:putative toxin-antitoxin system antitoxin component (TIGR02293 family)